MANIKISELNPLLTVEDADVLPIVDNAVTKKVTAAILRSYTEGNSVLLTGAQTIAGIKTFTSQLASSVATGTAPFSVASTTKVTNLNADLLDGLSSADFQATLSGSGIVKSTAGTISYLTDNSSNWNTAFNDKINSAAVTGIGTNTLTLTQQDAGTITATWVNGTLIREIRNNTGATLTKGTIVYISGATGNKPTVSKAIATGDSTSAQTFGFVQENIANNAEGFVVVIGDLTGVDTSAFTEGDQLYLSSTTAGAFTSTKQYAPNHLVYVGIVTRAHPTLGQIEVNIQNGYEMDELHNVAAQNPSNGDILQYVTSTGLWTKIAGTTSAISEGSNLYFTNARSRSAISLTTTGTSGAATYNSTTGVLNVPNYADTDTGITSLNGLTALTQTFAVGTSGTDFGISSATSTHTFNLPTASATNRGALSSADWTTFNNKQNAITLTTTGTSGAATLVGATLNIPNYGTALANYLPLAGGTLTGALGGTSASFSGAISANDLLTINYSDISTGADRGLRIVNTDPTEGTAYNITSGRTGQNNGDFVIRNTTTGVNNLFFNRTTGAATFSSSVTALGDAFFGTFNGNDKYHFEPFTNAAGGANNAYLVSGKADNNERSGFVFQARNSNGEEYNAVIFEGHNSTSTSTPLTIDSTGAATFSGSVGIGANPLAPLQVKGPTSLPENAFYLTNSAYSFGSTGSIIRMGHIATSGNAIGIIENLTTGGTVTGNLSLQPNGGNVGIGTTTPSEELEVYKSQNGITRLLVNNPDTTNTNSRAAINVGSGSVLGEMVAITGLGLYLGASSNNFLSLMTNGSSRLDITSGGNVLIGTSTDAGYKLDVNGTARVSGFLGVGITPDYAINAYSAGASTARISITGTTNFVCNQFNNSGGSMYFGIDDSAGSNFTGTAYKRFLYSGGGSDFGIYTNGLERLLINGATGAATFAGQVNIGNPVNAAVAVASTHKVTIVIGGVTYYLLASNV